MTSKLVTLLWTMLLLLGIAAAHAAAPADPAVAQVQTLTAALLRSMQAGPTVSTTQRYRDLAPVIEQVFALPLVTRLAVGPDWTKFPAEQQQALIAAFTRFTVANYVHNFREFSGEKFEVDDNAASRDAEKIVRARIIPPHDAPVSLLYRMRESQGAWKVIDVYSSGVSSLALRRSDFAAALTAGGAPELIAYLNRASEALLM